MSFSSEPASKTSCGLTTSRGCCLVRRSVQLSAKVNHRGLGKPLTHLTGGSYDGYWEVPVTFHGPPLHTQLWCGVGGWTPSCLAIAVLFTGDVVMLAPSSQGFRHTLGRFAAKWSSWDCNQLFLFQGLFDLWATMGSHIWQRSQNSSRRVEGIGDPIHGRKKCVMAYEVNLL